MPGRMHKTIVFAVTLLGFILFWTVPSQEKEEPVGKITAAWCWTADGSAETYIRQIDASENLDVVSPTGIYLVDENGALENRIDSGLVEYAHQKGKKVWALLGAHGFSKENVHEVLVDPDKRTKVINEVVEMAVSDNYDGVNIDWEGFYTDDRDLFTAFVRELTVSLKERNKVVSVDVTVLPTEFSENPFSNWVLCYDRKALGEIVDYVMLMAYDEHNQAWPNGSVASLPWVEDGVKRLLKDVPAEKVILGVPFYTHDFSEEFPNGSEYIGLDETQCRIAEYQAQITWDDVLGQYVAVYYTNGFKHTIWVEDDKSLGLKLDLVQKYNLAGMAAWSLGSESVSTWKVIGQKLGKELSSSD